MRCVLCPHEPHKDRCEVWESVIHPTADKAQCACLGLKPVVPEGRVTYGRMSASFHSNPAGEKLWRYSLERVWDVANRRTLIVIGLNPSTADETQDDPTIRRCVDYARRWGCGRYEMLNLFAYRSTDPEALYEKHRQGVDVIGLHNTGVLMHHTRHRRAIEDRPLILCAWGNHGDFLDRGLRVARLLHREGRDLHVLGLNKSSGQPVHPLYQKADLLPQSWDPGLGEAA